MSTGGELRNTFYLLLGAVAVAIAVAKIVGAENVFEPSRYTPPTAEDYSVNPPKPPRIWPDKRPEPTPMFSSNDRSRWATIRALVDNGTYVVGKRSNFKAEAGFTDSGIIFEDDYKSLDKVMNPETGEFYSSKPPLLSTVAAGEYLILKKAFGLSIDRDRWWVVGITLITFNVLPFAVYLLLLAKLIDELGTTDFGKMFAFTLATCGTFLTTFSATLNNHTPAAFCVLFAVYPLLKSGGTASLESPVKLALSGFFAGLTATLELPAASFLAGLFLPMLYLKPVKTLLFFAPAALLPLAGQTFCNYAALGTALPAYSDFGGPWYNIPGSHWAKLQQPGPHYGIDFAKESKEIYAFHLLGGHHGWFSLTPAWSIGFAGLVALSWAAGPQIPKLFARKIGSNPWSLPLIGAFTLVVSIVVIAFYVWKSNNYGGNTSAPRWLIWLTPLWLLATLPAADWLGKWRIGRGLAAILLGFSVLSVFFPAWNPWRPPWIQVLCETENWVRY